MFVTCRWFSNSNTCFIPSPNAHSRQDIPIDHHILCGAARPQISSLLNPPFKTDRFYWPSLDHPLRSVNSRAKAFW